MLGNRPDKHWKSHPVYGRRLNVLGFFSRNNQFHKCIVEGKVDSDAVINCFYEFTETLTG